MGKHDIKKNTIFLFLQSGIAPAVYPGDSVFENKYGVYFHDLGDVGFTDQTSLIKYNKVIFTHLTKKFGEKWEKEIRKDVIGFKEWKKK